MVSRKFSGTKSIHKGPHQGINFLALGIMLLCCSFFVESAVAYSEDRDENFLKYKDMMPKQITEMPKDQQDKVPTNILWAVQTSSLPDGGNMFVAMRLNQLMYSGIADLPAAIKAFQSDLGEKVTGQLTVGQLVELTDRARSLEVNIPYLSTVLSASSRETVDAGFAHITGSLELIGSEKIANPINQTNITCYRPEGVCRFEQVRLDIPDRNSFGTAVVIMGLDSVETFPIISWQNGNIETGVSNDSACRVRSLSMNFGTNEYYYITKNGQSQNEWYCSDLEKLDGPRIARIVDGSEIYSAVKQQLSDKQFDVLSSSFKQKMEELISELKNKGGSKKN